MRVSPRGEEGFTLIELLVVILIIGILLSIALPTFLNQQNKAKDTEAKSALNIAYKASKASAASRGGEYINAGFTAANLVTDITGSDPQLAGTTVSSSFTTGVTAQHVYLIDGSTDPDDTSANDLALAYPSLSGTIWYLRIVDHGPLDLDEDVTYNP